MRAKEQRKPGGSVLATHLRGRRRDWRSFAGGPAVGQSQVCAVATLLSEDSGLDLWVLCISSNQQRQLTEAWWGDGSGKNRYGHGKRSPVWKHSVNVKVIRLRVMPVGFPGGKW